MLKRPVDYGFMDYGFTPLPPPLLQHLGDADHRIKLPPGAGMAWVFRACLLFLFAAVGYGFPSGVPLRAPQVAHGQSTIVRVGCIVDGGPACCTHGRVTVSDKSFTYDISARAHCE